ncbi:MAG: class I SAM-dependent methyltransferase [Flavisolibacter sp.]
MPKDLFSGHSKSYAKYRPGYPKELFDYILQFVDKKHKAWDCATGNGQAAVVLADYFQKVEATDISESQIKNAVAKNNIKYHVCPAEHTTFPDHSFDLITVAQAYHWLNWKKFRQEVIRTGKSNAVIAIWTYGLMKTDDEKLKQLIDHFYYDIISSYWDAERKYVDESYETVEFDYKPLPTKDFSINLNWNKEAFLGYLSSWSAVQNYIKQNQLSPLDHIQKDLETMWDNTTEKKIEFPVFLKLGRV